MKLEVLDQRTLVWNLDKLRHRACPFCGACQEQSLVQYVRPDGLTVKRCGFCKGFFVSPAPAEDELNLFYSRYHNHYFANSKIMNASYVLKQAEMLDGDQDPRLLFIAKEFHQKQFDVLDFGCGNGLFLVKLQQTWEGASVNGIEYDDAAVEVCRQLGLSSVVRGGIEAIGTDGKKFDLIVLNDVIEHPLNPDIMIAKAKSALKVGGFILIWTPNGDRIDRDPLKVTLRLDLEHMQYLTASALKVLCENNGLCIIHYQTLGFPSTGSIEQSQLASLPLTSRMGRLAKVILQRLRLISLVKRGLARLGLYRSSNSDLRGDYHLFCVLKRLL